MGKQESESVLGIYVLAIKPTCFFFSPRVQARNFIHFFNKFLMSFYCDKTLRNKMLLCVALQPGIAKNLEIIFLYSLYMHLILRTIIMGIGQRSFFKKTLFIHSFSQSANNICGVPALCSTVFGRKHLPRRKYSRITSVQTIF